MQRGNQCNDNLQPEEYHHAGWRNTSRHQREPGSHDFGKPEVGMKKLSDQKEPGSVTIKNIEGPEALRLLEMGLTPGKKLDIVRAAPTGFPIEVKVRGYLLSLRKSEAECIEIE